MLAARDQESQGHEPGYLFAAHEVDLERPVLWHRGER